MNIIEFADRYLQPYKTKQNSKGTQIVPLYCPFCGGGNKKDKSTFAMSEIDGAYNCVRGKCGARGSFKDLCDKFNEKTDQQIEWRKNKMEEEKIYKKQPQKIEHKIDGIKEYMKLRKISEETYSGREVVEKDGNIMFPYRNMNDDIVLLKYRPAKKVKKGERKYWQGGGGVPILWGENYIDVDKPLIITEGEFDTLAIDEAFGYRTNSVSIPFGCNNFEWIDLCWSWLRKIKKIIICSDNDDAGQKMEKEAIKKLGEDVCYTVNYPEGAKDTNELLLKKGKDAVKKMIENASPVPVDGLIDGGDFFEQDVRNKEKILTPFSELNKLIRGLTLGEVSVFTGHTGNGKSTILGQFVLEAIEQNYASCIYSGELTANRFFEWIDIQAAGRNNLSFYDEYGGTQYPFVKKENLIKIKKWYKKKLFLYDNTLNVENTKNSGILKLFKYAARRHNCKLFIADNLMTAQYKESNETDFNRQQSHFMGELVHLAQYFNVHVIIVAHPRKLLGGKKSITIDDICGTSGIGNKADNIFGIESIESEGSGNESILTIKKNRAFLGTSCKKAIGLVFSQDCKRFWQQSAPGELHKKYSWED